MQHEHHQRRAIDAGHRDTDGRPVVSGMTRQPPYKDSPIGSRVYEAHEAKLRGQADLFDKDQHTGTMDGPPEPDTPESRARLAKLDAALEDHQAAPNQDRPPTSYDQARLDNITAVGALEQQLREVIAEARPHVYRQQGHGRHEQDRADAVAWMDKWIKPDGGE